jgi:hypothetical protein
VANSNAYSLLTDDKAAKADVECLAMLWNGHGSFKCEKCY